MPDGPGTPPPPDATPMPDRMPPTGGDGNDSFDDAVEIEVGGMAGAGGAIGTPRDHDFFRFTGEAGQWVIIDIDAPEGQIVTDVRPLPQRTPHAGMWCEAWILNLKS